MSKKINLYGDSPCVKDKDIAKYMSLETVNPKVYIGNKKINQKKKKKHLKLNNKYIMGEYYD